MTTGLQAIFRNLFLWLIVAAPSANAATFYVKQTATGSGNGSDWFQAMGASFTPTRGNVYYLADGAYGSKNWNTAVSGTSTITIKKATIADHGTSTGWSDALGDGAATFTDWAISTDDWVFDGVTGGGPGSWNSGFGITISSTSNILISITGTVDNITIRHVGCDSDRGTTFIAGIKGTTGACSNITISYCAFTEIFGPIFHIGSWSNVLVEYSFMYWNKNTAADHSEMVSSIGTNTNITWRWSIFDRIEGTAVFAGVNSGSSTNWQVYGNIFSRSTTPLYYYYEPPGSNQQTLTNSEFYNNTIYDGGPVSQGAFLAQNGSGNTAYNNLWYNNDANQFSFENVTHNWQWAAANIRSEGGPFDKDAEILSGEANGQNAGSTNPFVSYNTNPLLANLALSSATNAGTNTSATVPGNSVDMFGNTRGGDGTWDRGAIEYGVVSDTTAPTPNPSTFASVPAAVDSFSVTMTATTATDAGGPVEYYFEETTAHAGATDSGWQSSATYVDGGLSPNTQYTYYVWARDNSLNQTSPSGSFSATTPAVITGARANCETLNVTTLQVAAPLGAAQTTSQFGFTYPAFTGASGAMTAPQFVTSFSAAMHHPQQYRNWITEGKDIRLLNPAGIYAKHINIRTIYPDDLSHPNHDYVLNVHPEWLLLDGNGNPVSLFVPEEKCVDFANDAYLDWVLNTWLPTEFVDTTDDDSGLSTFYVHDNGNFLAQTITPNCSHSWCAPYKTDAGMQAAWKHMLDRFKARWPNKKILVSTGPVSYQTPAVQLPRFTDVLAHSDGYYSESLTNDHVYWSGQPNDQKRNALETTMQLADWLAVNNKYFFPNLGPGDGIEPTQAEVNYGYAFFNLMRAGTKQFFSMIVKDGSGNWQPEVYPEMNLTLGTSLEERTQISTNVYRRRFANATAYVNLSDSSTNITLPVGINKNSLGATVASPLTLPSFSGLTVYHY